jgi:hypothetical protein
MDDMSPTQKASHELVQVVLADPAERVRFELMVRETAKRDPVPDDFVWLSPDARPEPPFSRFKALAQKLLSVPKREADEVHRGH